MTTISTRTKSVKNERIVFMEAGILLDKLEEQNRLI